jgi:dipeptidyl aminopeptidase/acylaminoacyl peptidase
MCVRLTLVRCLTVLYLVAAFIGQSDAAGFRSPEDLVRLPRVGSPRISPDGKWIVYTVSVADLVNNRSETSLWMVDWDGKDPPVRLVDDTTVSMPRWSPDGGRIAFVSRQTGTPRLSVVSVNDRRVSAIPIGGAGHGPLSSHRYYSGLEWSPDGRTLVFAAQSLHDPDDIFLWKDWYRGEGFGDIRRRVHIWTVDADGGVPVQVTDGDFHHGQPSWSPDGQQIVFMSNRSGHEEEIQSNINQDYDIWVVPARGGTARKLSVSPGADIDPVWSPDGRSIAYASVAYRGSHNDVFRLKVVDAATGKATSLSGPPSFDYSVSLEAGYWAKSGLVFTSGVRTTVHLFKASPDGGLPTALTHGDRVVSSASLSADGQRVALTLEDPTHPPEVWVCSVDGSGLRQLTKLAQDVDASTLATTEVIRWRSRDGMEIEGLLVKPAGFRSDRQYPLVVRPHGGPHGAARVSFSAEYQIFASYGYLSFAPNFRGSSGYGQPFIDADRGALGGGDYLDLMSGVDYLIEQGFVDPERLVITGSSYGGFMTTWAVGHTDRFKAAVAGAAITDVFSYYGTTDMPGWIEWEYYGPPWKNPDLVRAYSPISYVQHVKTPTLMTHGADDVRVPLSQGRQFYFSLKTLGVPTGLVIYPDERHGISRPVHQVDRLRRTLEWFTRYLEASLSVKIGAFVSRATQDVPHR